MEEQHQEAAIDFIPALFFMKRGVSKERPDKVVLTPAELARVINNTKNELAEDDESDDENNEDIDMEVNGEGGNNNQQSSNDDEFNFEQYEEEPTAQVASIGDIAVIDENDIRENDDDDDSEEEDDIIKKNDNIILVGHVIDDAAMLEVWIFNQDEESFYTHHDFLLPSFPLCIEWLNHDSGSDKDGNLCAIGCMEPIISLWDLDIQDNIEPILKLGSKGSRKKNKPKYGHTDAVLDLSWNQHFPHILASASVDKSVILWDLDEGMPHTTITAFQDKVQTLAFHDTNPQSLLTGCSDGVVRLFDGRDSESINTNFIKWETQGEIEKTIWNPLDGNFFIAGTNNGNILYADARKPNQFLWQHKAHTDEITGICFNSKIKNLLTTTSSDGMFKVWKYCGSDLTEIYNHDFNLGRLQCMQQCPEDPFTFAFGGEKNPRLKVYNIKNFEAVRACFQLGNDDDSVS